MPSHTQGDSFNQFYYSICYLAFARTSTQEYVINGGDSLNIYNILICHLIEIK